MISLEPALAQEIVERTMKIVPFNVNVMDVHGFILGSGNPQRIGELHAGARLALAQSRTVEVDAAVTRSLEGAQPGVNIPLVVRGQVCGVVGISGEPDDVRQVGELVRVMAEMILEQAQLLRELQHEKRYREEFVDQLIAQEATSYADLERWGGRLGIDFRELRAAVVLELLDETVGPDRAMAELQRCQQHLAAWEPSLLMSAISPRELVMLPILGGNDEEGELAARARTLLQDLEGVMRPGLQAPAVVSIGVALSGIEGVPLSYQCAKRTARVGRARDKAGRLFSYYDLSFPVLLAGLSGGWQAKQLRLPLDRLAAADGRGLLRATLVAWFAQDCQAERAAQRLDIHRNTLDYRLRRIGAITGLDLARIDDRLVLYAALQLE